MRYGSFLFLKFEIGNVHRFLPVLTATEAFPLASSKLYFPLVQLDLDSKLTVVYCSTSRPWWISLLLHMKSETKCILLDMTLFLSHKKHLNKSTLHWNGVIKNNSKLKILFFCNNSFFPDSSLIFWQIIFTIQWL